MPRIPALPLAAVFAVLGAVSIPIAAQTPPSGSPPADSAPAKKVGRFGRLRATLLPGTTYAGRLITPLLEEAQEKGVPGLHIQEAIHAFTGPRGDYPALAEGPANQLAERLKKLIREEGGQQTRVSDSLRTSVYASAAAITGDSSHVRSVASGLQLPSDVIGALRAGRLSLRGINWGADDIPLENALTNDLKPVADVMNQLGGAWRIEVTAPSGEGGKEAARHRAITIGQALSNAGLKDLTGDENATLRPSRYGAAATARVEIVRP